MSAIKEYKCPACGGTMEFDSTSQKMKCPYCDTEISVEEYEALNESQTSEDKKSGQTEKSTKESTFVTYICESCGGEITADKTTGATTCPSSAFSIGVKKSLNIFDGFFCKRSN